MIRLTLIATLLMATPLAAAGPPDPDWPCIQRRQPHLSVAQVWSGPVPDEATEDRARDPQIQNLSRILAMRRTLMPDAEAMIADFAASHPPEDLTALFLATFEHIQISRNMIMAGITRYAHKQEALDQQINTRRAEFATLTNAEPQDFDAIDQAEKDIDWSTRIFLDRQQSLTYVCETPVILEQRAFAIGRAVMAHLPK